MNSKLNKIEFSACLHLLSLQDSTLFIEQHKSGFERPGDVEFEDYSHGTKSPASDSNLNQPKGRGKLWLFSKKNKVNFLCFLFYFSIWQPEYVLTTCASMLLWG